MTEVGSSGTRIVHVLFLDIVGYSRASMAGLARLLEQLNRGDRSLW